MLATLLPVLGANYVVISVPVLIVVLIILFLVLR
jgi:hypothetical protein